MQEFNQVQPLLKADDEMWKALADLDREHLADIVSIIRLVKNKALLWSTKIRDLKQIMYRDWLSDCADIIEKEMVRLYNLKKKPEESETPLDNDSNKNTQV